MTNEQLAHDLAIAKLYGSDLPVKELCEKYDQYYEEILDYLKSKPTSGNKVGGDSKTLVIYPACLPKASRLFTF